MKPTPRPAAMSPGARSVTGSGLTPGAFGAQHDEVGEFCPRDVELFPTGPREVNYYSGAQPPPAGGGGRAQKQIKSGPMGS